MGAPEEVRTVPDKGASGTWANTANGAASSPTLRKESQPAGREVGKSIRHVPLAVEKRKVQ
ncbi:hypothetical protein GCM10027346_04370 [Hymenobacter seoulensis]